jgi:NDP-sugar pyrophosphorylase family protein
MKNSLIWKSAIINENCSIKDAIENLNKCGIKIVLITNENAKFLGTLSDGDIRRGLLKGMSLDSSIKDIIFKKPVTVKNDTTREAVLKLMVDNKIQQVPIIDDNGHVSGLHLWDEFNDAAGHSNYFVIMAGGRGTRMHPYTENCPKPMLDVAGRPILEHIILRAKANGFNNFIICINFLGKIIEDYFGDGSRIDVNIQYIYEKEPLGTAGSLYHLKSYTDQPFVLTNGDVLTDINYSKLLDFHFNHHAYLTVAIKSHEWQNPFGVVEIEGLEIVELKEKPVYFSYISAGIYVLSNSSVELLEEDKYCDMPELIAKVKLKKNKVIAYPIHEPWLDVGNPNDLQLARNNNV